MSFARIAIVSLLVLGRVAHASNRDVARARAAMAEVKFEEAYRSLDTALQTGTSSRAELVEIYRLRGECAGNLGRGDAARQEYRHLFALDPDSKPLRSDESPKLLAWLDEARRSTAPLDLRIKVERIDTATAKIAVEVLADSTRLVAGARAEYRDGAGATRSVVSNATGQSVLELELAHPTDTVHTVVVDQYGNRLLEQELRVPAPAVPASTAVYAHPMLWAGVTVAAGLTTGALAVATQTAQSDLDRIRADPASYDRIEAETVAHRVEARALATNISLGVTVLAAAITAVTYWRLRTRRVHVSMVPDPKAPMIGIAIVH